MRTIFKEWPLMNYRTINNLAKKNIVYYYHINMDEIVTQNEAIQMEQDGTCKIDHEYYLVGKEDIINNVRYCIDNNQKPRMPKDIKNLIDEKDKKDGLYQDINLTKTCKKKIKNVHENNEQNNCVNLFDTLSPDIIKKEIFCFMSYKDIINICLLDKYRNEICHDMSIWIYLLERDFENKDVYDNIKQARSKYFKLNGRNVDYQLVSNKQVWKPKPGDFVSYHPSSHSYVVTSVIQNKNLTTISAVMKRCCPYTFDIISDLDINIVLKRGKDLSWTLLNKKEIHMIPGLLK